MKAVAYHVNMCSDARGDVVDDEVVVAKGVTVDTVVDGDEGKDMEVDEGGSVPCKHAQ